MQKRRDRKSIRLMAASAAGVLMSVALLSGCNAAQQGAGAGEVGSAALEATDVPNDADEASSTEAPAEASQDIRASEGSGESTKVSQGRFADLEAVTFDGASYTFPISGSDLVAAGWKADSAIELESSKDNTMFRLVDSCACYHEGLDAYVTLVLSNPTDHTVTSLDETEVVGITVEQGDAADDAAITICDGIKLGDNADRLFEAFGEPKNNSIVGYQNAGTSVTSGTIEWTFQSPQEKEIELCALVDVESNTIISIDISLSRF